MDIVPLCVLMDRDAVKVHEHAEKEVRLMDRDGVKVHEHAEKEVREYPVIWTEQAWS